MITKIMIMILTILVENLWKLMVTNIGSYLHTVRKKKDWTKRNIWSKTTLIASGVSGTGVNPPFCKMGIFFLWSLALSVPIRRNFQSNRVKWQSTLSKKCLFNTYYINIFLSKFETSPFTSIWLEISTNWYTKSQGPNKKIYPFYKREDSLFPRWHCSQLG